MERFCKYCHVLIPALGGITYCSAACQIYSRSKKLENGCWEWDKIVKNQRYGSLEYEGKTYRAHRLSYLVFNGNIPDKMLVCHSCDNPKCVNPEHLFLGTSKENTQDMMKKGRSIKGKRHFHKHSWKRCEQFFNLWKSGISIVKIAEDNQLSHGTVQYLIKKHSENIVVNIKDLPNNKDRPKFLKYSREKAGEVISLRNEGKTFVEIELLTGVKKSACKYICANPKRLE